MTPNTRTLKGQSYCSQRWANPVWPKGSKSRGFSSIPELIDEDMNGMTFESGNADDLAGKIKAMYNADFDYKAIADAAMERYNAENYYDEIMKCYIGL